MAIILNTISVTESFFFGAGIIYILLDATVGRLKILHSKFVWCGLQVKDFALVAVSIITILSLVNFVLPY